MSARFGVKGSKHDFYDDGGMSPAQVFRMLNENGLVLYEYHARTGFNHPPETYQAIASEALKNKVELSIHAAYFISIANEEKIQRSVRSILEAVRHAVDLGAKRIVIHTGSLKGRDRADALSVAAKTLRHTVSEIKGSEGSGFENVKIGIETMGKISQLGTLDEVVELCKIDAMLVPVIDFGHLYTHSIGQDMTCTDDYMRVFDTVEKGLGADALNGLHCHFSKIAYKDNIGETKHLNFSDDGFGPDYEQFIEAIVKAQISPDVICESKDNISGDARIMKEFYESVRGNGY